MIIELENAEEYLLAPLHSEALLYIGDRQMMNFLASIMEKGDLIATTGIETEKCILIVTWDQEKCEEMIKKAKELSKTIASS